MLLWKLIAKEQVKYICGSLSPFVRSSAALVDHYFLIHSLKKKKHQPWGPGLWRVEFDYWCIAALNVPMTQHPLMLRCLFCGEWHLLYNISPNKQITHQNIHCPSWFLVIMWPLETEMKPPGSAAHPRGRRIACMHTRTQSRWMHTCMGGISACLCFEASSARAACVIKSHSQRAVYPPRLRGSWHWQGMRTQRHMHKHNLHAWRNAQSV